MTGIFWHEGSGRWASKIGYRHNKAGVRTNAVFYFAAPHTAQPPAEVIADVVAKRREWTRIKADWASLSPMLAECDPDGDYSLPVWYRAEAFARPLDAKAEIAEVSAAWNAANAQERVQELRDAVANTSALPTAIEALRSAGLLPHGVSAPTRKPTIRQAIDEFLNGQEKRTKMKINSRTQIGTFNTKRNNLLLSVGLSIAAEPVERTKLIDLDKPLIALSQADIQSMADYWNTLPGDVKSSRTVANYLAAFKAFLTWCEEQEDLGFFKPKATARILHVESGGATEVTPVDYDVLKSILKDAPELTRLYAGLGLFCGFYQADIATLAKGEVQMIDGETYITGYRSKESAEMKEATKIKTTHWIPQELAEIMERNKAGANEWDCYFLNRYGQPMFTEKLKGGKSNAVAKAWEKVTADRPDAPTFKQLRKWGWNEIPKFADARKDRVCVGDTMSRRWAGQSGGGVAKAYRFDDYRPVIAAQRQWWKTLRKTILV